jgi:zinc transporter, ZIP family
MPEGIMAAVWAFSWGAVAASGALVGAILGLTANLRHRAIAAFMSLGAGVLLSAASFKVASEALILAGAALTTVAMIAGAATFSVANAALVKGRGPEALRGMQAAALGSRGARQWNLDYARHLT